MNVAEMRILRWMSGATLMDRIKMENILGKLEVIPIKDKIRENHLKWFVYVHRRPINITLSKKLIV